jgi:glycosyltransferase involved in cell wall biosynthesis
MKILTSVLLTYNHEKSVAKAFDSILEQKTDFEFEIFVLEDRSTDRTTDICREYKEKYPDKISLFLNEKNLGVTRNLKQGLLNVKSKYFAFLEGDDYWCDKNKLQKQVEALEQNPDCMICGHNTLFKDIVTRKEWLLVDSSKFNIKSKYTLKDNFGVHPSSRVYRNTIDLTDVPSNMLFDTHIYLLYLTRGDLFYIDEVMSVYNKTGTSFWSGKSRKERRLLALELRYQANKYFNFAYDYKYYPNSKYLKALKSILGIKLGWFWFYHLERLRLQLKYMIHKQIGQVDED